MKKLLVGLLIVSNVAAAQDGIIPLGYPEGSYQQGYQQGY